VSDYDTTLFTPGGTCACGAAVQLAPGIGPYSTRTGVDAPCTPTVRRKRIGAHDAVRSGRELMTT
jgi:hypothetical protein